MINELENIFEEIEELKKNSRFNEEELKKNFLFVIRKVKELKINLKDSNFSSTFDPQLQTLPIEELIVRVLLFENFFLEEEIKSFLGNSEENYRIFKIWKKYLNFYIKKRIYSLDERIVEDDRFFLDIKNKKTILKTYFLCSLFSERKKSVSILEHILFKELSKIDHLLYSDVFVFLNKNDFEELNKSNLKCNLFVFNCLPGEFFILKKNFGLIKKINKFEFSIISFNDLIFENKSELFHFIPECFKASYEFYYKYSHSRLLSEILIFLPKVKVFLREFLLAIYRLVWGHK